jgi:hypothetical protein
MIEWEDGSTTEEGLQAMIIDDRMSCYEYGKLHGLLDEDGWKRLKKCAHYVEQVRKKVFSATTVYSTRFEPSIQFGIPVPRNHKEAMKLDEKNGNTKWKDAIATELSSIISFDAFKDRGHHTKAKIPSGRVQEDHRTSRIWRETRWKTQGTPGCRRTSYGQSDRVRLL